VKRLLAVLALALAYAAPARAQVVEVTQFPLIVDDELDQVTNFRYCHTQGIVRATADNTTRAEGVLATIPGAVKISTATAGATTVSATVATSAPFSALQVGDYIRAVTSGVPRPDLVDAVEAQQRPWLKVVTRPDADTITVNQPVDFTVTGGVSFEWRRGMCRITHGFGWVPVKGFDRAKFTFAVNQQNTTTGIDVQVQCRDDLPGLDTESFVVVYPYDGATCGPGTLSSDFCVFTANGGSNGKLAVEVDTKAWYECRVGYRINSTDDGGDLTVNSERVRVVVTLVKEK
jgi:hypothetical protein